MVDKFVNLILTLNCPTVSIDESTLALFAEFKSLTAMPEGIRTPVSISNFVSTKFVPVLSIDIAPSIRFISDLWGALLDGIWRM